MNNGERIYTILEIVKRATAFIKLLPFMYVSAYILCAVAYFFVGEETQTALDMLFYTPPVFIVFAIILSRIFRLCKWHRLECSLPLLPFAIVIYDTYYPLDELAAKLDIAVIGILFSLSVVNAYFVFFRRP